MALTRSMLKGMGLTDEQIGAIIDAHSETVDGLKADRDKWKESAESAGKKLKDFEDLSAEDWKGRYDKEHKEYEDYKKSVSEKEKLTEVKSAYRKLLSEQGVADKHIDAILKVTDFSKMKVADGKLEGEDKLVESIKSDWAGFISTTKTRGADVETPPASEKKALTKEEIMKIKDTSERQAAWADYLSNQGE